MKMEKLMKRDQKSVNNSNFYFLLFWQRTFLLNENCDPLEWQKIKKCNFSPSMKKF